mmetsp:Transcript_38041/g.68787  ORF Transcript_38041/g.68787 Transcript_38041/m.68787 type:complete len:93 (+) Transcript_38041:355-633(+)
MRRAVPARPWSGPRPFTKHRADLGRARPNQLQSYFQQFKLEGNGLEDLRFDAQALQLLASFRKKQLQLALAFVCNHPLSYNFSQTTALWRHP